MPSRCQHEMCFDKLTGELFAVGQKAETFFNENRARHKKAGESLVLVSWSGPRAYGFLSADLLEHPSCRVALVRERKAYEKAESVSARSLADFRSRSRERKLARRAEVGCA